MPLGDAFGPIYLLWKDIQDIIGCKDKWPRIIHQIKWKKDIGHFDRTFLCAFCWVDGPAPQIIYEWLEMFMYTILLLISTCSACSNILMRADITGCMSAISPITDMNGSMDLSEDIEVRVFIYIDFFKFSSTL